jgi:hypothetical protein
MVKIVLIHPVAFELTGLGRGGQQIQKCKDTYRKAVQVLVELASLQVTFFQIKDRPLL